MRYLLVLAFAAVALAGTIQRPDDFELSPIDNDSEIEVIYENEADEIAEIAPFFIISWKARRAIRKLQKQMPCGFPQYGIPPLAPLKKREANLHWIEGPVETNDVFNYLRVDGLDNFKINRFKLNVILSKVTFDFNFENIRITAPEYASNTVLDALRQLGLSVRYEGNGALDFSLKNLRVAGTLKYKIPILWGSIKITSLKTTVTLGSCESQITGFLGNGKLNDLLNRQLENAIVSSINGNQQLVTESIESNVVPRVNKFLKGNDFWTILDLIFKDDGAQSEDDPIVTKCVAPKNPWA